MKKIKFENNFDIDAMLITAKNDGIVVFNPLTGLKPTGRYMVEVHSREVDGNEEYIKSYILVNSEALLKTEWNIVLFCNSAEEYRIGMMYATNHIENAVDAAKAIGEDHIWTNGSEFIKPYDTTNCITEVQIMVERMKWIENFYSFKTI